MTKLLRRDFSRVTEVDQQDNHAFFSQLMRPQALREDWPVVTVEVITRFPPSDYIDAYPLNLVSESLKQVIEQHGANADFYPVELIYRRQPYTTKRYYACHIRDHIACWDYERGEYTFWEREDIKDRVRDVTLLAVDEGHASQYALFRLAKGGELYILCSDALGDAIKNGGFSGLYFLDLPSDQIHVMGPPSEQTSSDASEIDKVREVMTELHGEITDFEIVNEGEPEFTVNVTDNGTDIKAVFTNGSADCDLYLPSGRKINTEVKLLLPADWPVEEKILDDERWNWPLQWLQKIVREAHDAFTYDYPPQWPDDLAAIFMNGNPPAPLAANTQLCGWVCIHEEDAQFETPPSFWFDIRLLIPIYLEEQELIENEGIHVFLSRMEQHGIPLWIDPERPNVATLGD